MVLEFTQESMSLNNKLLIGKRLNGRSEIVFQGFLAQEHVGNSKGPCPKWS